MPAPARRESPAANNYAHVELNIYSIEDPKNRLRPQAGPEDMEGVYIISVAARILEMHPQTLRKYERVGLVRPSRTVGMLRLYSEIDIARLKLIKHLVGDLGLNLAGVQLVMEMFNHMVDTRDRLEVMDNEGVKRFVSDRFEEMFELLHAHLI